MGPGKWNWMPSALWNWVPSALWNWVPSVLVGLTVGARVMPSMAADRPVFEVTNHGADLTDDQPDDEAWSKCLQAAIKAGGVCRIGKGTLTLTRYPAELRQSGPITQNRNLNGLVIEGAGEDKTTVHGRSAKGFDVFQLNAVSHLTIRHLTITAIKTTADETQGVNGISITNGTSHLVIEQVTVRGMPYSLRAGGFDGGKAFTVQQGLLGAESSTEIEVRDCTVFDSPIGGDVSASPNYKVCPGRIRFHNNRLQSLTLGFSLSFSGKNGGGAECPGLAVEITGNNLIDCTRALYIGRVPDAVFRDNAVLTTRTSGLPDPMIHPGIPLVIIGGPRARIEDNTIVYRPAVSTFALIGGAPGGATSDQLTFLGNRLSGPAEYGVKTLNDGIINSRFSGNSLYGPTAQHDSTLINNSLKNTWKQSK